MSKVATPLTTVAVSVLLESSTLDDPVLTAIVTVDVLSEVITLPNLSFSTTLNVDNGWPAVPLIEAELDAFDADDESPLASDPPQPW